jgi:hypothetical protein
MTTFSGQVSQSTDDGEQSNTGTITLTGGNLVCDASQPWAAYRFQNVTVPSGATVSAATVSQFFSGTKTATNYTIYGNNVANPVTLATTTSYISGLAQTSQTATWSAAITVGQFNTSPSVSSIVSALIALGSWASGNAMLFMLNGITAATSAAIWTAYDGTPANAEEISITYTSTTPGAPTGLTAAYASSTSVALAWTQGSGTVTDNKVQWSTDNATWNTTDIGSAATSYTVTGLTASTLYYFQVNAGNSGSFSAYSAYVVWVSGANFTVQVSASTDDAYQASSGSVTLTDPTDTINVGLGLFTDYLGFRFLSPGIAYDQDIQTAYLDLNLPSVSGIAGTVSINAQLSTAPATFVASTNNISSRTFTGSPTAWLLTAASAGWNTSPNVAPAIQAIVDQAGAASTDPIALVVTGGTGVSGFEVQMWDGNAPTSAVLWGTYIPTLTISVSDTIEAKDGFSTLLSHLRTVSSTVEAKDSLLPPAVTWRRLTADTVEAKDSLAAILSHLRIVADTFEVFDSLLPQQMVWRRGLSDNVEALSGVSVQAILYRMLADTVEAKSGISVQTEYLRSLQDTIQVFDQAPTRTFYYRTFADPVGITDLVGRGLIKNLAVIADTIEVKSGPVGLGFVKMLSNLQDTVGVTDGFKVLRAALRQVADTVGVTDYVPAPLDLPGWNLALSDLVEVIAGHWTFFVPTIWTAAIQDLIAVTDLIVNPIIVSKNRLVADTVGLTDSVATAALWRRVLRDTIESKDSVARSTIALRLVSDLVALSDQAARGGIFYREVAEIIGVLDFPTFLRATSILISETVAVTTASPVQTIARRAFSDHVEVSDAALTQARLLRLVSDQIGITDAVQRGLIALRTLADVVGITDTRATAATWRRTLRDVLGVNDEVLEAVIALRKLADSIGVSDNPTTAGIYLRQLADAFQITDAVQTIDISDASGYVEGDIQAVQGYVDGADAVDGYVDGADAVQP